MIIKVKKYVAKISNYVEHADGTITKEESEIEIKGRRISEAGVWKQIPRGASLVSHGYVEKAYEVDTQKLEEFLSSNGKVVE